MSQQSHSGSGDNVGLDNYELHISGQTFGYSLNLDYRISSQALFRMEGRAMNSRDKIFTLGNDPANNNYFLTTSLGISL